MTTKDAPAASFAGGSIDEQPRGRAPRIALAVVLFLLAAVVAVQLLPWFGDVNPRVLLGPVRPLLYFTVQSNLLAAVVMVLVAVALLRGRMPSRATEYLRGLATVDLAITGVVYGLLLGDDGDVVLHIVMPVLMALWWIAMPPQPAVAWFAPAVWLLHPVAWLVVVFGLRAVSSDHWVPYYFLDPRLAGGWPGVAGYTIAIIAALAVFGVLAVGIDRAARWRRGVWRGFGLA